MDNKIHILFSSFPDFSGNPKALFEYININYQDEFYLHWVVYSDELFSKLTEKGIHCVLYKSEEYNSLIEKINIVFDTNGFLFSEKRADLIYVNLWHGFGPKKSGYLLKESNLAPKDHEYCELAKRKTDFLVVPSEFAKTIFASIFNINAYRVLPLGYPRIDYLLNSNGKNNLQKLTNKKIKNYNKIIFYLPTFRNGCARNESNNLFEYNLLNLEHYDENILINYLKKNNYLLVVKKHPAEENALSTHDNDNILIIEDHKMTENFLTINEILNAADLLITDYSSIYVEYLVLNKPILFLHRDIEEYIKSRGILLDNSEIWFPGPKPLNIHDCLDEISMLLSDENYYSKERKSSKELMLCPDISNSSKNIFEFLFDTKDLSLKHKPYVSPEDRLEGDVATLQATLETTISGKNSIISEKDTKINELTYNNNNLDSYIKYLEDERTKLQDQLDLIHNSRSWKLFEFIQQLKHKRTK